MLHLYHATAAPVADPKVDLRRANSERRPRRERIFEKVNDSLGDDVSSLSTVLHGDYIDDITRQNLADALGGFYFLSGGKMDPKMDLLLCAMQKEEFEEGFLLINEVSLCFQDQSSRLR
jgi:hypothetical protein